MTVSVITTCYNTERYIAQCLDSILASTHQDLDVVVVDDGSTDHTLDIAGKFESDSRVRVFETKHIGRRAALELAHMVAHGETVCWVDSDDFVQPEAIQACLDVLDDDHRMAYTHRRVLVGDRLVDDPKNSILYSPLRLLVDNMTFHLRLFTTDLFEEAGGVGKLESAIDWDMNLRMTEHTDVAVVDRALYVYRIREGRMSGTDRQKVDSIRAVTSALLRRGLDYDLEIDANGWHLKHGGYR